MTGTANPKRYHALVTGLPHFAERIAELVRSDAWSVRTIAQRPPSGLFSRRLFEIRLLAHAAFSNVIYQIGGPFVAVRLLRLCRFLGQPMVLHWVGSDVSRARGDMRVREQSAHGAVTHWADCPWLQSELQAAGVESKVVPSCAVAVADPPPLPSGPLTALCYLPAGQWDFYGGTAILALAKALPEVQFLVVGCEGSTSSVPSNMDFLGWVRDMDAVYARCHLLIRFPIHDGLSSMVVESLARGRHVVWNHFLPGVLLASTPAEIAVHVTQLSEQQRRGSLLPNETGRGFAQSEYNPASVSSKIQDGFREAMGRRAPSHRRAWMNS